MNWIDNSVLKKLLIAYSWIGGILTLGMFIFIIIDLFSGANGLRIFILTMILLWMLAFLLGPWIFVGIVGYLIKRNKYMVAKIISVIGFLGMGLGVSFFLYDLFEFSWSSGINQLFSPILGIFILTLIFLTVFFIISYREISNSNQLTTK